MSNKNDISVDLLMELYDTVSDDGKRIMLTLLRDHAERDRQKDKRPTRRLE